jgi:hypothetical protein
VLKNVNKFDDFAAHFSISNLRYAENIKGFDLYDIFRQHLHSLGLGDFFVNKHLPKNRDSHGPASDADGVETVQSSTKLYTQQGKYPSEECSIHKYHSKKYDILEHCSNGQSQQQRNPEFFKRRKR